MICCVTGHRSKGFPFPRDSCHIEYIDYIDTLRREIEKLLREDCRDFVCGMAEGADLDFAKQVLAFRLDEGNITLEAALPYPVQTLKRKTVYSEMRDDLIFECDCKTIVSQYYHKGCMQKRNQYMVDKSDLVLAIWNGERSGGTWNTIQYAQSQGKPIRFILLKEMGKRFR